VGKNSPSLLPFCICVLCCEPIFSEVHWIPGMTGQMDKHLVTKAKTIPRLCLTNPEMMINQTTSVTTRPPFD
jgi:hypothetical protein